MASSRICRVAAGFARKSLVSNYTRALLCGQEKAKIVHSEHRQIHTTSNWLSGKPVQMSSEELKYTESVMSALNIKGSMKEMEQQLDTLVKDCTGLNKSSFTFGGINYLVHQDEISCLKKSKEYECPPMSLAPFVLKETGMTEKEVSEIAAKLPTLQVRRVKGRGKMTSEQMQILLKEGGDQDWDTVTADQLQHGDIVEVKPGCMFPVDGKVLMDSSDEYAVGSKVAAGSQNGFSSVLVLADDVGSDTKMAKMNRDLTDPERDELNLDSVDPEVASFLNYYSRYIRNKTNYPRSRINCVLVFSRNEIRDIGCVCDDEGEDMHKYMSLHKYQARRCECGHWFALIPLNYEEQEVRDAYK